MSNFCKFTSLGAGLAMAAAFLLAAGCGSGGSNTKIRVMNAAPGEASLEVLLSSASISSGITYGTASGYVSEAAGSPTLVIEPTGSTTALINESITITSGTQYTIVATGYPPNLNLVQFTDNNAAPPSGDVNLRLINSSPSLGTADVYVVAPGTDLGSVSPTVTGLSFVSASNYVSMTAGSYEIFFTPTGQKSGGSDSGSLTFSAGQVRTVVGLNGTTTGYTTAVLSDVN